MAEGAPLLREYVGKTCIEGSNPSGSARTLVKTGLRGPFAFPTPEQTPVQAADFLALEARPGHAIVVIALLDQVERSSLRQ